MHCSTPYTPDSFLEEYPEFSAVHESVLCRNLEQAGLLLRPSAWGTWWRMAVGLWTAHYLALEYDVEVQCAALGKRGPYETGQTTSMSVSTGGMSLSRALSSMASSKDPFLVDFCRTSYGMRYLNLLNVVIAPGTVVFSGDSSGSAMR